MRESLMVERKKATYDDLRKVPDHLVAEILGGELYTSPRPASPHARAGSVMGIDLGGPFDRKPGDPGGPGGWWLLDEPELHLHGDVLVPDLAGWRRERMPSLPSVPAFELVPDWVCEVVSPSTVRVDRVIKMSIYAREKVPYCWMVDPLNKALEVFRLQGASWVLASAHGGDEKIRAEPFDAVELDLTRWWLES